MLVKGHAQPVLITSTVSLRCPGCRQMGTFAAVLSNDLDVVSQATQIPRTPSSVITVGLRRCPNPDCWTVVYVLFNKASGCRVVESYPTERLDFDTTGIPASITAALEEAITCHANQCYIAAAMMVRKSLEELCLANGATGANLHARLKDLETKVTLPRDLLDGLHVLKLLGNDAAHIESKTFDSIGKDEVEAGILFSKEVLKAVYQYADLLAKLTKLKKKATSAP
jgi:hypothetical protein